MSVEINFDWQAAFASRLAPTLVYRLTEKSHRQYRPAGASALATQGGNFI
ncbi:hypothetical protein J3D47_000331 [Pseudomonas laurylsulfativorans]|nr:hypothetical protein [Pseudomonas laurylsulfativorans]MCP1416088.1 hypothetical protein [Pseudomonas laurylsulfativorans]